MSPGSNKGSRQGRSMGGGGRQQGGTGAGVGGNCVCPQCGAILAHQQGQPCFEVKCPKCGAQMIRE